MHYGIRPALLCRLGAFQYLLRRKNSLRKNQRRFRASTYKVAKYLRGKGPPPVSYWRRWQGMKNLPSREVSFTYLYLYLYILVDGYLCSSVNSRQFTIYIFFHVIYEVSCSSGVTRSRPTDDLFPTKYIYICIHLPTYLRTYVPITYLLYRHHFQSQQTGSLYGK